MTVTPGTGRLRTADTLAFSAAVKGTGQFNSAVTWLVDGIPGGDVTHGTISGGLYVAPANVPNPNPVTITAKSVQDSTKSDSATTSVYSIAITPSNPTVPYGHTQQFTAQVTGLRNAAVQFRMVQGNGQITTGGLFDAPTNIVNPVEVDEIAASVNGGGSAVTTQVNVRGTR